MAPVWHGQRCRGVGSLLFLSRRDQSLRSHGAPQPPEVRGRGLDFSDTRKSFTDKPRNLGFTQVRRGQEAA